MNSSRTLAHNLRKLADWLDSRPEFPMGDVDTIASVHCLGYDRDKDMFIKAVKAIGKGVKSDGILDSYLRFTATDCPKGTSFKMEIDRSSVCRLVRPARAAEWECEPLLSQAEQEELGVEL